MALVKPYLRAVQGNNNKAVNEALADLFIEEEDYEVCRLTKNHKNKFDLGTSGIYRCV